jgi:hypothetical protein
MMGWVVNKDASDRASHADPSADMHTRWDHHRGQWHRAHCEMECIQTRTMPSDEDAIDPATVTKGGIVRPAGARVRRREDIASKHHGGKLLCMMGMGSRPGCVRSSIAWRSWTTHAHTMGPSRKGAWCTLCNGLHPTTYRAIRRGRDRLPLTGTSVRSLDPADARVGRCPDGASRNHGGKLLCMMGWVVGQDASDGASHGDPGRNMYTRWDHHRGQGLRGLGLGSVAMEGAKMATL